MISQEGAILLALGTAKLTPQALLSQGCLLPLKLCILYNVIMSYMS